MVLDTINKLGREIGKQIIPGTNPVSENIKHLAISLADTKFLNKDKYDIDKVLTKRNKLVKDLIVQQVEKNITVMTIYLLGQHTLPKRDYAKKLIHYIELLFDELEEFEFIAEKKIRIFVLGKWYDLSGNCVDSIKNCVEQTKDYDDYFLNFCINYSGRDEIVDACKLLARKVKFGKIEVDDIDALMIKDNLSSSYFIPPEKIIYVSKRKRLLSFMLWDNAYSKIIFTNKNWDDVSAKELLN